MRNGLSPLEPQEEGFLLYLDLKGMELRFLIFTIFFENLNFARVISKAVVHILVVWNSCAYILGIIRLKNMEENPCFHEEIFVFLE